MKKKAVLLVLISVILIGCIKETPIANFEIKSPEGKYLEGTTLFENKSINAETYFWEFGDGETSKEFEPTHNYVDKRVYKVSLTVENKNGIDKKVISYNYE